MAPPLYAKIESSVFRDPLATDPVIDPPEQPPSTGYDAAHGGWHDSASLHALPPTAAPILLVIVEHWMAEQGGDGHAAGVTFFSVRPHGPVLRRMLNPTSISAESFCPAARVAAHIVNERDIMVSMNEQAPAGWYPDDQGQERYWDGTSWTPQVRDLQHAGPAEEVPKKDGAFGKMGSLIRKAASDRQSTKDEFQRKQAEAALAAGDLMTSGVFGTSTIEVYAGGYVRVAEGKRESNQAARITNKTPYEKLRSIKFSGEGPAPQQSGFETSALMKGASTLIRGGSSAFKVTAPGLALTGLSQVAKAKFGKTALTIATDQRIHTITNEVHNGVMIVTKGDHNDVGLALVEAGNSVLESQGIRAQEPPPGDNSQLASALSSSSLGRASAPSAEPSVGDRLRELAELHRDGILSDEEFASAKAKLLGL